MKKANIILIIIILTVWLLISLCNDKLIDYFIIPVFIAVVAGLFTNILQSFFEQKDRLNRINKKLRAYTGDYNVYHWRDLLQPDPCNYKINISLDRKTGILTISQSGNNPYDILISNIKIDEATLSYGEGVYVHPQKEKTPFGKIQIYLINENTINVDKTYLSTEDGSTFVSNAEKWQWRKALSD